MSGKKVRVFEGAYVPSIFEDLLVPKGEDPDGLGPLSDEERILRLDYTEACHRMLWPLRRLAKAVYEHQKYQLQHSHVIADPKGEAADNMDIEDICRWFVKLGVLTPNNPDQAFEDGKAISRFAILPWVYDRCALEGIYQELIAQVAAWSEMGAFETTPYPGEYPIDGDGHYPIMVADDCLAVAGLEMVELDPEFARILGQPPVRTQSRSFTDCQFQKGKSGNPGGRPRRPRETEDIDERRPHFFDTLMPPDGAGNQITYGEQIFIMAKNRAVSDEDGAWLFKMMNWAKELDRLRSKRKKVRATAFVYDDRLEVTRIDIAIRHLSLADVQWRKQPSARWVINPWLVSAALERMKEGQLSRPDMEGIYVRTRAPQHVDWPDWWPDDLRCKHSENGQLERPRRKISGYMTKP